MLTVHHLENSRSQRVLWLLEELALPYRVVLHKRDPRTLLAPEALRAVHPLGKAPVLVDEGQALAESGAILEYLVERYDTGHDFSPPQEPTLSEERLLYRYWMHYAEGSAMPPMLLTLVLRRIRNAPMPFFARPIARALVDRTLSAFVSPQVRLHLDWMEQALDGGGWFAGERFTAADIQMSFPIEAAAARAGLDSYPNLRGFLERIHARPAYQRALEQGGPFSVATG
ncbi:Glutathione S-transferase domain [Pseudoxanthomonas suwonensis 11-1]|uniref:glutathione transferase n=1 Tax=Pseudoxanthomonas suwonensis (strain 11-1) TaxID=743721 RepID=E6WT62_PSEUU|nr:glutathione S-transferase [Pseudoxanthomonas suwonensis]ADV27291.1 Glutathione S-transferase domain [Pseudoxanthomonas suwonensis 11-1]